MTASEHRQILHAVLIALLPALAGICFAYLLRANGIAAADAARGEHLAMLLLFSAQDGLGAALVALALLAAWRLPLLSAPGRIAQAGAVGAAALPFAAFGLSVLIGFAAFHAYPMSLDEFMPEFQAEIFRNGALLAPIDGAALALNQTLQPHFTYVDEARGLWASNYRPVHAALIALTPRLAEMSLLNPLMAAVSIWAIADIARRLFPDDRFAPALAALLLLSSPQFLINAGSGFSYPAHLAVNLVWLALFLRDRLWSHVAAALIGALAIGLHQVHVHPLFVTPFLAGMLFGVFGPRWRLAIYVPVYAAALLAWMSWHEIATWLQTADASVLPRSLIEIAYIQDYLRYSAEVDPYESGVTGYFLIANLLRFLLWTSPAILLLCAFALRALPRLHPVAKLAGLGVVLMVAATHVLMPNQMQSWGARYYHPVLGNMVLLAVAGLASTPRALRARLAGQAATAIAVSLVLLVPVRAVQVEAKVGPRAAVQARIDALDADVVALPRTAIWFAPDFIRNDPFLRNRPLLAENTQGADLGQLGKTLITLTSEDLWAFGLPHGTLYEPGGPR